MGLSNFFKRLDETLKILAKNPLEEGETCRNEREQGTKNKSTNDVDLTYPS